MKWYWAILFTVAILLPCLFSSQVIGFDLTWILVVGTSLWAAIDSSKINLRAYKSGISYGPVFLFVLHLLLWIAAFPWYLSVRYKIRNGLLERRPDSEATTVAKPETV